MGKSEGGKGGSSKKQAFEEIVNALLAFENQLPPRGLHCKKKWRSAWQSRVTDAGKSGNVLELGKAAVEIAFQMKDEISTLWWTSLRLEWQKKVKSSTTDSALFSRLTELVKKAVYWPAARNMFSWDSSESDRSENSVDDSDEDRVERDLSGVDEVPISVTIADRRETTKDDRRRGRVDRDLSGVDEDGTGRPRTRHLVMMAKEKRAKKASRKADEDSRGKKPKSESPPRDVRRSKRKFIVEDDEEPSHEDSPDGETPDVDLIIDEKRSSKAKRKKGRKADEEHVSDRKEDKSDEDRSESDTQGDQSHQTPDEDLVIDQKRSFKAKRKKGRKADEEYLSDRNEDKSDRDQSESDTQGDQSHQTSDEDLIIDEKRSSKAKGKKGRKADEEYLSDRNEDKSDRDQSESDTQGDRSHQTPDEDLIIDEKRSSKAKGKKGRKADEEYLSDRNEDNSDRDQSESDTQGDQSSIDETKIKQHRREGHSIEAAKHEQGTEDEQESAAIDIKTYIWYSRVRRSKTK